MQKARDKKVSGPKARVRKFKSAYDHRALIRGQLEAAAQALTLTRQAEAVHRCRTSLKRARALARMAAFAEPGLAGQMIAAIRPVMRRFSPARDLDALEAAAKAASEVVVEEARGALRTVTRKLAAQRKAAPAPAFAEAGVEIGALLHYLQTWPLLHGASLELGAKRLARRARNGYARQGETGAISDRHAWRKREKERLYAVLLLGENWPKSLPRARTRAQRLGEALGAERDVLMLLDKIAAEPSLAGAPDEADRVMTALAKHHQKLRKRADKLGAALHRNR